jgi:DNA mismatch repair protein MutS2
MSKFRKTIRRPETLGGKRMQRHFFDVTLDLHGYTGDEAVRELEDELYVADVSSILIIHGRGEGILKRRIRAYLSSSDLPRLVEYGEEANLPGGDGVTVVYL